MLADKQKLVYLRRYPLPTGERDQKRSSVSEVEYPSQWKKTKSYDILGQASSQGFLSHNYWFSSGTKQVIVQSL
jgi:hypothetical protein